ncbi:TrmO-like, N-terminal domain [Dillenia turbinata]|uniref:TrmO-like, N-terminal domain n=1 Tax=Dillenia turbinata TaxID=194707 RepID=A0AAN8ZLZ5_9MAGN
MSMAAYRLTAWPTAILAVAVAALSVYISFSRRKSRELERKVGELEISLKESLAKCGAERQGRIRAQLALRNALAKPLSHDLELTSFPMTPIGTIQSCFSTRNGTPRQPLLVPLSRACLVFDSSRVPPASLEGLGEYSHCWILYIFHLNTDLEKLWKHPSKSKFKAKACSTNIVPRLKGGRMGVFATRSPHRPCPIGLTVCKIEAIQGHMILLSGLDLVDGTPVLDIKPYIPYCDSIQGATMPTWVSVDNVLSVASVSFSESFSLALADCWVESEKMSLYASPNEFQSLIKQVLSWDIRSVSQRIRPHNSRTNVGTGDFASNTTDFADYSDEEVGDDRSHGISLSSEDIVYHLILEGLDISYKIDCAGNVIVENVTPSNIPKTQKNRSNYMIWKDKLS